MNTNFIPKTTTCIGIKWRAKNNPSLHCLLTIPKCLVLFPTMQAVSVMPCSNMQPCTSSQCWYNTNSLEISLFEIQIILFLGLGIKTKKPWVD